MNGRLRPKYIAGVRRFINFAFSIAKNVSREKIRCPYMRCKNQNFLKECDVCKYLLTKGFFYFDMKIELYMGRLMSHNQYWLDLHRLGLVML
jgi:hypothetical protein